jgi:hypothetical protein
MGTHTILLRLPTGKKEVNDFVEKVVLRNALIYHADHFGVIRSLIG